MSHCYYNSFDRHFKMPFGALREGETVQICIDTLPECDIYAPRIEIFEADRFHKPFTLVGMVPHPDRPNCYMAEFSIPLAGLYFYRFIMWKEGKEVLMLKGHHGNAQIGATGEMWALTVYDHDFTTPDKFKGGIMYQIFPDRFCNSKTPKEGVPDDRIMREDWGALPKYQPDPDGIYRPNDYFGGDLEGIRQKLPHLARMGVTTIYLNPIFEAHSNHRYNTADYRRIDPLLGNQEDFVRLCREAKEMGIGIMLDGVFSHTGSDSIYFDREGRYDAKGAYEGPDSAYYQWFSFGEHPNSYDSWWGFDTLPNVQENTPSYRKFICGEDGVLDKWLSLGADGWRLDVADELPDLFLDALRRGIKERHPDALVLGEVWEDASTKFAYGERRRYLLGGQLDSVMNYPFRDAILAFVCGGGGEEFIYSVSSILENYPKCVCDLLMNFLSTHDVERALTRLGGEPMNSRDRTWQAMHHLMSEKNYSIATKRLKLAALLQYTLPGIPCLYYGDEAGMTGYRDPFNRVCYPWGHENVDLLEFFEKLGQFRRSHGLFAEGDFTALCAERQYCAYLRREGDRAVAVLLNTGHQHVTFLLPMGFVPDQEHFAVGSWDPRSGILAARSGVLIPGRME